ncbi:MAG: hypothetical protein N3A55_01285 [Methylohalobius sp.]|nr:hypothetical protein [Methylohalobius sp.]
MIVHHGTTLWRALKSDWPALVYFLALSLAVEFVYEYTPLAHTTTLPTLPMGVLITALSIFLAFQINQCYERWWEARQLWGQLVNASRSFGRQVTTLLTAGRIASLGDEQAAWRLQKELVYRLIAYVHALRISLRHGQPAEEDWQLLSSWLPPDEIQRLHQARNVPTQILQHQGRRLASVIGKDIAEQQILLQIDMTLNQIYEVQGGCERIKRTAFPDRFRFHTHLFVWLVATLIPFSLIQTDQRFDVAAILAEALLAFILVTIERLGSELRDPFENKVNDVPMTALCRIIEIDLRQQLEERDALPEPLSAVAGVLL